MTFDLGLVKRFGVNFAVGLATDAVRAWLNEKLQNVSPSDLYEAIIHDADIWTLMPPNVKQDGLNYKKTYGHLFKKFHHHITTELLLEWMKEDHPALYSTIINIPAEYGKLAGIIWFDKQVNIIKQHIIEY